MSYLHDLQYAPINENELEHLDAVLSPALHFNSGGTIEWANIAGWQTMRAVKRRGRIVAGLGILPMGQWFGAASVPMAAITAVGVAPECRGSGVGSAMVRAMLEEVRDRGFPLSALYPATLPFYQRAGYERAGMMMTYELPISAIDARERTLEVVPFGPEQYAQVRHVYEQRARQSSGQLDRPEWMWRQRLEPDKQPLFRYLVTGDDQAQGYVVFTQGSRTDPIRVIDVCALTRAAGRHLLALFAGYRSMVETLIWRGGPFDPLAYLLAEQLIGGMRLQYNIARSFEWLLRIVDLPKALSARGYPTGLTAQLHLDVRDDLLPANNGRFVLEVAAGQAHVHAGGQGRIRLSVRELAALYSGHMSPADLRVLGAIDAPADDLALAGLLFAGPRPWMADMF